MNGQNSVSSAMALELDARIQQAGGDIAAVRHEIEDELHAAEMHEGTVDQVRIALLLGEIEYLDAKAEEQEQRVEERHEGLVDRIRALFHTSS